MQKRYLARTMHPLKWRLRQRATSRFVLLALAAIAIGVLPSARAEAAPARRALLVGIDKYQPTTAPAEGAGAPEGRRWIDLDGAVNDARAMRDVLVDKLAFRADAQEIRLLTDAQATRAAILSNIADWLLAGAAAGDVRVFYYAGHGSQTKNSQSPEDDRMDETLVPADAARGVPDIRDKELAKLFDAAARSGVQLVVILDSCHSGSATRGPPRGKSRHIAPSARDVADPGKAPDPIAAGALVISAAQDTQRAEEDEDETKTPHGAFTLAFIRSLRSVPADESIGSIFRKTRAILQRDGSAQEPVLGALDERKQRSLLGAAPNSGARRLLMALATVRGANDLELQAGRAEGLGAGSELLKVEKGRPTGVRIRIDEVLSLGRSRARIVKGAVGSVKPGDLFTVDRWVPSEGAQLVTWVPPALPIRDSSAAWAEVQELASAGRLTISTDPSVEPPTDYIWWTGSAWHLQSPQGATSLGNPLSRAALDRWLRGRGGGSIPVVFVSLPPPPEVRTKLTLGTGSRNEAVEVRADPTGAEYGLAGRLVAGTLELAWLYQGINERAKQAGAPLPLRSDWLRADAATTAAQLSDLAARLGGIRAWLVLPSPPVGEPFPYRLGFRNVSSGAVIGAESRLVEGDRYQLVLRTDQPPREPVPGRYVYVFSIDSSGRGTLLFPRGGGVEHAFPRTSSEPPPATIDLPVKLAIVPPFGVDHYLLLTTADPLPDPYVLEWSPVKARSAPAPGKTSPLDSLLRRVGSQTRAAAVAVPVEWSLDRVWLKSEPRSK